MSVSVNNGLLGPNAAMFALRGCEKQTVALGAQ